MYENDIKYGTVTRSVTAIWMINYKKVEANWKET